MAVQHSSLQQQHRSAVRSARAGATLGFGTLLLVAPCAHAAESAFSLYGLGSQAFGAGATPPPGFYVTPNAYFYAGDIDGNVPIGGGLSVGLDVSLFVAGLNALYVPEAEVLGGHLGLSANLPVGYIDLGAEASAGTGSLAATVNSWGLGDLSLKAQLGWTSGTFSHTAYATGYLPTGKWEPGFSPNIGLNHFGVDVGWGFTYVIESTGLQFDGAFGVVINAENPDTDYRTGSEFHAEAAIAKNFANGWTLGLVGYGYQQFTGDTGSGATLGDFKGRVFGLGPAIGYATLIGGTPFILNARYYHEFDAKNRFEGDSAIVTATLVF